MPTILPIAILFVLALCVFCVVELRRQKGVPQAHRMPFPTPIGEQRQIGRRDDAVGRAGGRFDCREKGFSTVQISFFVGRWSLVVGRC